MPDEWRESREMEKMANVLLQSSESICLLLSWRDGDGDTPGAISLKVTHDKIDQGSTCSCWKHSNPFDLVHDLQVFKHRRDGAGNDTRYIVASELLFRLFLRGESHVCFLLPVEKLTATSCQRAKANKHRYSTAKMVKRCRLLAKAV